MWAHYVRYCSLALGVLSCSLCASLGQLRLIFIAFSCRAERQRLFSEFDKNKDGFVTAGEGCHTGSCVTVERYSKAPSMVTDGGAACRGLAGQARSFR